MKLKHLVIAFLTSASPLMANWYIGGGLGYADGLDDFDSGIASSLRFGYELGGDAPFRQAVELELGGSAFDTEFTETVVIDDGEGSEEAELTTEADLTILQAIINYRLIYFFQQPDQGLFINGGLGLGAAKADLDADSTLVLESETLEAELDLESETVAVGQVLAGLGWAFNENMRVEVSGRLVFVQDLQDVDDPSETIIISDDSSYQVFDISFIYLF